MGRAPKSSGNRAIAGSRDRERPNLIIEKKSRNNQTRPRVLGGSKAAARPGDAPHDSGPCLLLREGQRHCTSGSPRSMSSMARHWIEPATTEKEGRRSRTRIRRLDNATGIPASVVAGDLSHRIIVGSIDAPQIPLPSYAHGFRIDLVDRPDYFRFSQPGIFALPSRHRLAAPDGARHALAHD